MAREKCEKMLHPQNGEPDIRNKKQSEKKE